MKNLLSFILLFGGAAFLVLLVSQNHSLMSHGYSFRMNLGFLQLRFVPVRLDVLLLIAIGCGYGWAWVSQVPSRFGKSMEVRRLRKTVKTMEKNEGSGLTGSTDIVPSVPTEPTE